MNTGPKTRFPTYTFNCHELQNLETEKNNMTATTNLKEYAAGDHFVKILDRHTIACR